MLSDRGEREREREGRVRFGRLGFEGDGLREMDWNVGWLDIREGFRFFYVVVWFCLISCVIRGLNWLYLILLVLWYNK